MSEVTLNEIQEIVTKGMNAFEEFKAANDERLKEIEKKGQSDPVLDEKLERINKALGQFDDLSAKFQKEADARKAAEEHAEALTTEIEQMKERVANMETSIRRPGTGKDGTVDDPEYKAAFDFFLRNDISMVNSEQRSLLEERKALVMADDTAAGYYAAPAQMETDIVKAVVEMSPFRTLARVTQIGRRSLIIPKRTGTFAAQRVAESGTRAETEGYTAGQVEIVAPEMFADVRLSQQLLEDSFVNLESEMNMEFSEQFAVKEGAEFISGNGAGECEGILTASGTNEVVSGTAATIADANGQANGIIDAYHEIKTAYASNASWVLNRKTLGSIRKLKDGNNNYIWVPGLANLRPNTILDAPYTEMPDMPDEAANAYPVAFGDWRRSYRIADRVGMSILRDPYTQANVGRIKFLARRRVGGAVVLAEAIVKVKCST